MTWYTIEPRDPLLVRDGRPFGADSDGARTLPFPPPSVLAGAFRTRVWHSKEGGWNVAEAKALPIKGPVLCSLDRTGDNTEIVSQLWFAGPRDCALFDPERATTKQASQQTSKPSGWRRYGLIPEPEPSTTPSSMGDRQATQHLCWVVPATTLPEAKPPRESPAFWSGEALRNWLSRPPTGEDWLDKGLTRKPLTREMRTHVGIDPRSDTAQDGKLFQTEGIRFCEGHREDSGKWVTKRFGLLAQCTHPNIRPGLLHLGGERRVSDLQLATNAETMFWKAPELGTHARVVLLTPAVFTEGAIPTQIGGAPVIAAAVGRPETISGWDMTQGNGGAPKPSRRLAPAGSVYWVDLSGVADHGAWANKVHFQSVCSADQDNLDGFGLAAVGVA